MNFTNKVQQRFKEAGWNPNRNVLDQYNQTYLDRIPSFLKEFLKEYGNLTALDCKEYKSNVVNELKILPIFTFLLSEDEDDYDYLFPILNREVYIFAYFLQDGYYIGCDEDGKVYMIRDYCFLRGDTLQEGIENILADDWKGSKELDVKSGTWTTKYRY